MAANNFEAMDFQQQLRRRLNYIITSCRAYDEGRYEEATRIAVVARVLFHDTKNSHSLVSHYLKQGAIKMRSTTAYSLPCLKRHALGFIGMAPSIGMFQPYFDHSPSDCQVPLSDWWGMEPILELFNEQGTITRRDVALDATNKDGGAHVDPHKPARFSRLEVGLGIELKVTMASGEDTMVTLRYANMAILRQIGHEILTSAELLALAG